MFMFGQTGSGKTHTMTSIESRAAKDIFESEGGGGWGAREENEKIAENFHQCWNICGLEAPQ